MNSPEINRQAFRLRETIPEPERHFFQNKL